MACDSPGCGIVPSLRAILLVACVCLSRTSSVSAFYSSEGGCDWEGSGLHRETSASPMSNELRSSREVVPVYLRCDQGTIVWHYPRGALRVLLRHGTSGRDFRACVRVASNSSGAAIHLEGHRRLLPVFQGPREDGEDTVRCFASYRGQVALFLEATPGPHLRRNTLRLWYHLTPVSSPRELLKDDTECRPCSDRELLHLYCSSDFVVEGNVSRLQHVTRRDVTEIHVRATRIHRSDSTPRGSGDTMFLLERPLKCGTRAGRGSFLFVGQLVLGRSTLRCAPRLEHWKELRDRATRKGTAACALS
uniref:Putative secreted protein n=1 Tax=Ornithodoros turicata TaxID=34597 RepID=A0A2R5L442_9ACAR